MNLDDLPLRLRDRIDDFLEELDKGLEDQGFTSEDIADEIERIEESLLTRIGNRNIQNLSATEIDGLLTRLKPEIYLAVKPTQREEIPSGPRLPDKPRLSRTAILSLAWALCFPLMVGLAWIPESSTPGKEPGGLQKLGVNAIVSLGILSPVGAFALGLVAIRQIRFSRGFLLGETLARSVTLYFPAAILALGIGVISNHWLANLQSTSNVHVAAWLCGLSAATIWILLMQGWLKKWTKRMESSGQYWRIVESVPRSARQSMFDRNEKS